jgi:hypothetical protein
LSVWATGSGNLTYQWYRNRADSNVGGDKLGGQTASSIAINTLEQSEWYYYVEITNTEPNGAVSNIVSQVSKVIVSDVALRVAIQVRDNDVKGYVEFYAQILSQPKSAGAISYQWYESANADGSQAKAINKAWGNVLRLKTQDVRDSRGKGKYYFVSINATTKDSHSSATSQVETVNIRAQASEINSSIIIAILLVAMILFAMVTVILLKCAKRNKMRDRSMMYQHNTRIV